MLQSYKQMGKAMGFVLFLSLGEPYSPLSFGHNIPFRTDLISLYFIVTSMRHIGDLSI